MPLQNFIEMATLPNLSESNWASQLSNAYQMHWPNNHAQVSRRGQDYTIYVSYVYCKEVTEQNELYWTENPTNRVSCSRRGRVLNNDELVLMKLVKVWCYHDLVFLRTYPNKLQIILRIVLADLLDGASCLHCEVGDQ